MALVCGHGKPALAICEALGLGNHEIARLVIDVQPDDVIRVYVQKLMDKKEIEPLCAVLRDANERIKVTDCEAIYVDERGNVDVRERDRELGG